MAYYGLVKHKLCKYKNVLEITRTNPDSGEVVKVKMSLYHLTKEESGVIRSLIVPSLDEPVFTIKKMMFFQGDFVSKDSDPFSCELSGEAAEKMHTRKSTYAKFWARVKVCAENRLPVYVDFYFMNSDDIDSFRIYLTKAMMDDLLEYEAFSRPSHQVPWKSYYNKVFVDEEVSNLVNKLGEDASIEILKRAMGKSTLLLAE